METAESSHLKIADAEWYARRFANVPLEISDESPRQDEAVEVRVNHGRWIVDCLDCGSAQYAVATDKRFMCADCGNVAVGGRFRLVIWPKRAAKIDDLLRARPLTTNQNWTPDQSVNDLKNENLQHGIA